ncbi:MAG: hypothetical protein KDA28_10095 [Phycisphaerales bacterium]|nr:hypothetical protein [Phycisphaerales bacterium]
MNQYLEHEHHEPDAWHRHLSAEGMPQAEHGARVNPFVVGGALGIIGLATVGTIVAVALYFNSYSDRLKIERQEGPAAARMVSQDQRLAKLEWENALQAYSWIDTEAGTVGIPIDRAFELVMEQYGTE